MKVTVLNEAKAMKLSNGVTLEDFKDSDGVSCEFNNKEADPVNWVQATVQFDYKYNIDGNKFLRLVMWNITKGKPRYYKLFSLKEKSAASSEYEKIKGGYVSALRKGKGSFGKLETAMKGIANSLGMVDDEVMALAVYNKNHGTDFSYAGRQVLPNGELGARL